MQNFDLGVETQKRRCPLPTHQHRDHLRRACDVSPPQVPALLLIDLQLGFDEPNWGKRNNPELEIHAAAVLGRWRELSWPVIHIQHSSQNRIRLCAQTTRVGPSNRKPCHAQVRQSLASPSTAPSSARRSQITYANEASKRW